MHVRRVEGVVLALTLLLPSIFSFSVVSAGTEFQTQLLFELQGGKGHIAIIEFQTPSKCESWADTSGVAWRSISGFDSGTVPRGRVWDVYVTGVQAVHWSAGDAERTGLRSTSRSTVHASGPGGYPQPGTYVVYAGIVPEDGRDPEAHHLTLDFQCDKPFKVLKETGAEFHHLVASQFSGDAGVHWPGFWWPALHASTNLTARLTFEGEGVVRYDVEYHRVESDVPNRGFVRAGLANATDYREERRGLTDDARPFTLFEHVQRPDTVTLNFDAAAVNAEPHAWAFGWPTGALDVSASR